MRDESAAAQHQAYTVFRMESLRAPAWLTEAASFLGERRKGQPPKQPPSLRAKPHKRGAPRVHLPGIYLLVASTAAAAAAISAPVSEAADQQQNPQPVIAASAAITGKTASTAISVIAHAADQENQEDQVTAVIIAIIGTATAISTIGSS